jgi:hypothetical protein
MSPKIEVEETNLEDLILLGEDKLINIEIEYPTEDGKRIKAKAKIKQLTMKELRNMDYNNINLETSIQMLNKSLFKQDGTPFDEKLILELPVGVVTAISKKILEISGMDTDMGF